MEREWVIEAAKELSTSLAAEFLAGPIINEDGQRFLTEEQVGALDGLKVEIFSREHPPPNFRVSYAGDTANFSIWDCNHLNGGLAKWNRNIRKWHAEHKQDLIAARDRTRPSDCPVGKYVE